MNTGDPTTKTESEIHQKRRNLLKFALFGGSTFVLGKLFGSVTDLFSDKVVSDVEFSNFNFVETQKKLTISEKGGEPLLIVEKESFK